MPFVDSSTSEDRAQSVKKFYEGMGFKLTDEFVGDLVAEREAAETARELRLQEIDRQNHEFEMARQKQEMIAVSLLVGLAVVGSLVFWLYCQRIARAAANATLNAAAASVRAGRHLSSKRDQIAAEINRRANQTE